MTKPFDPLALRIGDAYRRGLAAHVEAGNLLAKKKASLKHGEWLPWLKANANAIGFDSDRTAQRLIKLAAENPTLTTDLPDAHEITRQLWGNKSKPTRTPTPDAQVDPILEPRQSYQSYTPVKYVAMVKRVFGGEIELDAASCPEANTKYVKARKFYARDQDGLLHPWKGKVYLNPPFQSPIMTKFVDKLIEERANGNCTEAILLSNGATDTRWFHKVFEHAAVICFTKGRVPFHLPGDDNRTSTPGFGGAFSYFGKNHRKFAATFREIGVVKAL